MKYIELSTAKKARIRRALGVSRVTLWSALTFQTQSALAEKIRRMAMQDGGRVMSEVDVTNGLMPAVCGGLFRLSRTVFEWCSTTPHARPTSAGTGVP